MPLWGKIVKSEGKIFEPKDLLDPANYEMVEETAEAALGANAEDSIRAGQPKWYARRTIIDLSLEGVLDGVELDLSMASTAFNAGDTIAFIDMADMTNVEMIKVESVAPGCKHTLASAPSIAGEAMLVKAFGMMPAESFGTDGEFEEPTHYVVEPGCRVVWAIFPVTANMILNDQASEEHPLAKVGIVSTGWYRFAMAQAEDGATMVRAELLVGIKNFEKAAEETPAP